MFIYLAVLLISVLPLYFAENTLSFSGENGQLQKKKQYWLFFLASSFILVFFALARDITVGADYQRYGTHFYSGRIYNRYEPAFGILCRIVGSLTDNFNLFSDIILGLALSMILLSIALNKTANWLSLLLFQSLYTYALCFSAMRQAAALGLVMPAISLLLNAENKFLRWVAPLLLIFVATGFHYSAIISLVYYMAVLIQRQWRWYIPILLGAALIFFFHNQILNFLLSLVSSKAHYAGYQPDWGKVTIALLCAFLLCVFLPRLRKNKAENSELNEAESTLLNLLFLALIFNLFFSWVPSHYRVTQYFFLGISLLLPKVFQKDRPGDWLAIAVAVLYYGYTLHANDIAVVPYRFSFAAF